MTEDLDLTKDLMLESDEMETDSEEFFEHHRVVCDAGQTLIRIDKFLTDRIPKLSRSKIQTLIATGLIKVNDKDVKSNYKVRPLEVITVVFPTPPPDKTVIAENIPLEIVYEDEDVMVIHKQPGLVVHPGFGIKNGTLINALAYHFRNQTTSLPVMEGNQDDRIGLVHRIDKDTSGLMVIAKTEFAMAHLSKQFFDHSIARTYQALVWGNFEEKGGTIEGHIGRNPRNRMQMHVFPDGEEGKEAITHYTVLEDLYYVSLVECRLETGRTHQIRTHMKYLGHPLFNDERYGGNDILKGTVFTKYRQFVENCFEIIPRQALHAKSLGFVHPTSGKFMHFESELPEDFKQVLEKWRHYLQYRKEKLENDTSE